jgi:hypothetical protein
MTTTTLRRLASSAVVVIAASLLSGCATHPAGPISEQDLAVARSFRLFTVYWVGRSFDGVALTAADTQRDYNAVAGERVYYGNCDKPSSVVSTVGCRLPLEIATVEYYKIDSRRNIGLGTRTVTAIRGVPAVIFDGGRSIQLYTAKLAIDIYADTPERATAAAQLVGPMNRTAGGRSGALKLPVFAKDIDPRLRVIEHQLTAARAAAAAAPGKRRQPATGTTGSSGTSGASGASSSAGASVAPPALGTTSPDGRPRPSTKRSKAG